VFAEYDENRIERFDIHDAISKAISLIHMVYERDGIKIIKNFGARNHFVKGNSGEFNQVVMNFVTNARDALEGQKDKRIEIATGGNTEKIRISFRDNGSGIQRHKLKKIFTTFFTDKPAGKGTGLGLSISKTIIEKMNGKIDVYSSFGSGTIFTIILPVSTINDGAVRKDEVKKDKAFYPEIEGRALVVDDETHIRDLLRGYLEKFGLDVDEASDGVEALNKVKENKYEYVITDLVMPEMNGEKLIREIKKLNISGMKIFIVTGNINPEGSDIFQHENDSICGIIQKPFTMASLFEILKREEDDSVNSVKK